MNSIHNNGPDDKLLNDELEKLGQDYQHHSSEEPPELLDQAILNSAHRAVENTDHWLDFGWVHGLTTAAVVVLALSIIMTQRQPTGLEDNGLTPVDSPSLGRSLESESEMSGKMREQSVSELNYMTKESKQELRKDASSVSSDTMLQTVPAASAPAVQAGVRAEPEVARKARDEIRAKKSVPPEKVLLEEDIMPMNAPAEAEADERQIDANKLDADRIHAERSRSITAEEQLQAILLMKLEGDDKWEAELKTFIEDYPDYPLPDELKH